MAASVPASADEIDELRGQIEAMQSKLVTLEESQEAAKQEQQYVAAPANAVVGGDKPGSFRLPGSNTSVAIGGYAKLDLIYDINNYQGNSFSFGGIPLNAPPNSARTEADGNFRLHARQSRLWVKTWTPTDWGEFATHIEGDFEGAGGNEVFSNSSSFRLRHAYGQLGNVLAGQTWTNFSTPFEWPGTIDFFGTIGTSFVRQAQLRYTAPLGNGMSLAVAIENPENDGLLCNAGLGGCTAAVRTGTAGTNATATAAGVSGSRSTDAAPDLTARFQWGANWGTVAVAAVGRYFRVLEGSAIAAMTPTSTSYSGADDTAFGWGANVAAVFNLPWGNDSVGVQGIYGDGLGRYGIWGGPAYIASNAGPNAAAPNIQTVETWGANAWIEHWWTSSLFSVLAGGYASFNYPTGFAQGFTDHIVSGHVNLQWKPVSRATIGIEGSYGHRETTAGLQGDATRVQVGFQWGFST
ncbi:MAG: hypothetical protein GY791_21195 [Alphaproteobacteria bacterium]|nr:hypothetical protein [Alphaproteobacteria bacterium]